jgi:single-stranded-DNA-specific exonuclease
MLKPQIIKKSKTIIDQRFTKLEFLELLLKNRNIKPIDFDSFLKPISPKKFTLNDFKINQAQFDKAVKRIETAKKLNQNVLIYGDYDVDGITATAILWQSLFKYGLKVVPFIPDRENDGYGIKAKSVFEFQKLKNIKFDLLITVDNGIVAHNEIQKIVKEGTDVIITDHHLNTDTLPPNIACIHSTIISGCAIAWVLAKHFNREADLGLVALGTVADCLPLNGINRSIVVHGLQELRLNPNFGIKKLIQVSGVKTNSVSAYDLGYILGPRINAVGRLSNPTDALRLLCSHTLAQASQYSKILDSYNKDRQSLQQESLELAKDLVKNNKDKLVFISDPSFHPGIIGLIAGKMTETYYLPSIVISCENEICKGSCRSIKELNIVECLRENSEYLLELGGHAGAAGFSLKKSKIKKFKTAITKTINKNLKGLDLKPSIVVDAEMKLKAVNLKNCQTIQELEPFGVENQEPLFLFNSLTVISKKVLGSHSDHLKLKLDDPSTSKLEKILATGLDAIAFKKGDLDKVIKIGDQIDLIASLCVNTWNNVSTPQLVIKEIFTHNN